MYSQIKLPQKNSEEDIIPFPGSEIHGKECAKVIVGDLESLNLQLLNIIRNTSINQYAHREVLIVWDERFSKSSKKITPLQLLLFLSKIPKIDYLNIKLILNCSPSRLKYIYLDFLVSMSRLNLDILSLTGA